VRIAELDATNEHLRERVAELETAEREARAAADRQVADAGAASDARLATATNAREGAERRAPPPPARPDGVPGQRAALGATHRQALEDAGSRHASALAEKESRGSAAEQKALDLQRRCEALEAELATTRAASGSDPDHAAALAEERAHWEAERTAAREREGTLA